MAFRTVLRCVVVSLAVGASLTIPAAAQYYGPEGTLSYGYPYPQATPGPYDYGYGGEFTVPPPSRSIPGFSYNANPYAQFPNSYSYELPSDSFMPNTYTYDLRAYGYGSPPAMYPPPVYPYGYYPYPYPSPYPYYYPGPRYRQGIFRQMTLREYINKQFHGPVRVRDIVPGIPELGGSPPER
jgi:hypothetical protein